MKPKKFPEYEFHPLIEDEPMASPELRADMTADMKENGFDERLPIVLYENMIIAGRNRYLSAKDAGVIPVFETVNTLKEAKEFIYRENYLRKHLSAEYLEKRREKRNAEIMAMRSEGMSQRDIADKVKVSKKTVQNVLEDAQVDTPYPPEEITGKDGKSYPATHENHAPRAILCDRCQRVGKTPNCLACAEAKKAVREKLVKPPNPEPVEKEKTPEQMMKFVNNQIEGWCKNLMRFTSTLPSDPWIDDKTLNLVQKKFKGATAAIRFCKCNHLCPKCHGAGCINCRQSGKVNSVLYSSLGGKKK